ncbi:MAG TPA: RlmE family RNA methyltransferase [Methanothermococcus okinawensis]|uniref:Ribosomal RNA large subunit methyltransferase E n=1 Tax=Methanothermococcus okinawensis TaxID=155863 RepID=A0A832ZBC5_9EURY|nr:RlmE family RNA methyltransferase [Methanococcaceae archaeon]HIP84610.1 RlmE family RNA methyltransferase [Methanothermococcus okinawensis]HIP91474.1 RlmE family RNA methyltransferase [Methanothermococcus okinawensis]
MGRKDKRWVLQRKRDPYYQLAKKSNYRSRAVYKLLQLNEKFKVIKEGDVVVDLGCAPGGWLQAVRSIVGDRGFVVGVDLQSVKPLGYDNVITIKGDMTRRETLEKILSYLPSKADVVVSDASPNISGVWDVDHSRSVELTTVALIVATNLLKEGGNFVVKVFQGNLFNDYVDLVRNYFKKVYISKPRASRDSSAEVYVIGKKFLGKNFDMNLDSPILTLVKECPLCIDKKEEKEDKNRCKGKNIKLTLEGGRGSLIKKIKEMRKGS